MPLRNTRFLTKSFNATRISDAYFSGIAAGGHLAFFNAPLIRLFFAPEFRRDPAARRSRKAGQ
jgi:hypothetical protein